MSGIDVSFKYISEINELYEDAKIVEIIRIGVLNKAIGLDFDSNEVSE